MYKCSANYRKLMDRSTRSSPPATDEELGRGWKRLDGQHRYDVNDSNADAERGETMMRDRPAKNMIDKAINFSKERSESWERKREYIKKGGRL